MIRRTAFLLHAERERVRVAILGAGMSGCTVASTLLASPEGEFDITVYERGRTVGGRMATRRYIDTNSGKQQAQFDHGCQVIRPPKTEEFRSEFERWEERGWVRPWEGRFGEISRVSEYDAESSTEDHKFHYEETTDKAYVGHPRMSAVCENLLRTKSEKSTLQVVLETTARAVHQPATRNEDPEFRWKIDQNTPRGLQILGEFDWLVATDRNSFLDTRYDLKWANVEDIALQANRRMESVPNIVTMVKFHEPLGLNVDGLRLDNNDNAMRAAFGSLGWIARDSSKPGRRPDMEEEVEDDESCPSECWLLGASRREGKRLLGRRELKGASKERVQYAIRETMVEDFVRAIPRIASIVNDGDDGGSPVEIPPVAQAAGHRWGAAFPHHLLSRKAGRNAFLDAWRGKECIVEGRKQFVACGDYFGEHHGSVEGAFLSGRAAADALIREAVQ